MLEEIADGVALEDRVGGLFHLQPERIVAAVADEQRDVGFGPDGADSHHLAREVDDLVVPDERQQVVR